MDENTRAILKEAKALDNKTKRDFEQRVERERRPTIIRKDYDPPDLLTSRPSSRPSTMSASTQEPWDRWCDARIENALESYRKQRMTPAIGMALGQTRAELRKEIESARRQAMINNYELAAMRKEIRELNHEIEVLRVDQQIDRGAHAKVINLPGPFLQKRDRNVA